MSMMSMNAKSARMLLVPLLALPFLLFACSKFLDPFSGLPVATPQLTPASGSYSVDQFVTITDSTPGASIYYTTDGSTPSGYSTPYTSPIAVSGNGTTMTVKAMATMTNMNDSAVSTGTYTINQSAVATPLFTPTSGSYSSDQTVSLTDTTPGATIYYTTDGSTPSTSSTAYTTPLSVSGNGTTLTVRAMATAPSMVQSSASSAAYTINYAQVSTPQFSPAPGTYSPTQSVTITDGTQNSTIYYTTDGSTPTVSSSVYSSPIALSGGGRTLAIRAMATHVGMTASTVASASYGITYTGPSAVWAQSATGGTLDSVFSATAVDAWGNIYAVGYVAGTGTYSFGNGVSVTGTYTGDNVVIVKYNSSRTPEWAETVTAGTSDSVFTGVTVDPSGNVCAVGYISGTTAYSFGTAASSVPATGAATGDNLVVVKYDPTGVPLWAETVVAGSSTSPSASAFNAVTSDSAGNFYTAGYLTGTGTYGLGNSISVTSGSSSTGQSALVAEYGPNGNAQWAETQVSGSGASALNSVAVDGSGNVYAAGDLFTATPTGSLTWVFGSVTLNSTLYTGSHDALLLEYDSTGTAGWGQIVSGGDSIYSGVAADTSGSVYAVGYLGATASYSFGSGVTASGSSTTNNLVLARYNTSGAAQWASTTSAGSLDSGLSSVAVDGSGNVLVAGYLSGTQSYGLGGGLTVNGDFSGYNLLLASFNGSGTALWAQTIQSGTGTDSYFNGVVSDSSGNVYAVGKISGTGSYGLGNSVSVAGGSTGWNAVAVRYTGG